MRDFALSGLIVSILVLFFAKYDPAVKDAVFSILGVASAAYCVWLTVRIANSRDKRAIRTTVILVLVFVVYPLSMGPMVSAWRTRLFAKCHAACVQSGLHACKIDNPVWTAFNWSLDVLGT